MSFCGIECDTWADELIQHLKLRLDGLTPDSRWHEYFCQKFEQQARMDHDSLFFVGSQMNNLYSFFEELGDEHACDQLWRLEQECC